VKLKGWNPWMLAAGALVIVMTPVAALQAGRYWGSQVALLGALGLLMLGLARH
jgi:hypothetical protein